MNADGQEITDDAILNGRMRLFQPRRGHRFGHDAILLAAATPAKPGDRIVELGAGVGAASLALLTRVPDIDVTLIDIDPALTALASQNIARNGFAEKARSVTLDVAAPDSAFEDAHLRTGTFDHVLMNPPFNDASLQASPDRARRRAHMAADDTLHVWLRRAVHLLRPSGSVTLIWRAQTQQAAIEEFSPAFGAITVLPVYPGQGQSPIRVLVNARRGAREPLRVLPGLVLTDQDRRPSAAADAVMRDGLPLSLESSSAPSGDDAGITSSAARAAVPHSTTDVRKP